MGGSKALVGGNFLTIFQTIFINFSYQSYQKWLLKIINEFFLIKKVNYGVKISLN